MANHQVIVIGAGIAGLTSAALLAHEGLEVSLLEAHSQTGGCAGTFRRGKYIFDVGATQVAGFEKGGIHERIFRFLDYPQPLAKILDPACVVQLADESKAIKLFYDQELWEQERKVQFPGSENFWNICKQLHSSNWAFAKREPILPIKSLWDLQQFLQAVRPLTIFSSLFTKLSVLDLLNLSSCTHDLRLRRFLELQLKLYSQESIENTAALYGATVLHIAQRPLGLWHLQGSMQSLSSALQTCFLRDKGNLFLRHKVVGISMGRNNIWEVKVTDQKGIIQRFCGSDLIFSLPPQSILQLMPPGSGIPESYREELINLSKPSGAIVLYGALERQHLPANYPFHLQLEIDEVDSIFLSISQEGDGRAPIGQVTIIASQFTDINAWNFFEDKEYYSKKELCKQKILRAINSYFQLDSEMWLHQELATPRSFAKWTGRPKGIVGGLGQNLENFGPFGLHSRTPMKGFWLCGDSIYPGEGTAGVSQSALMVSRQLMARKGRQFKLPQ